MKWHRTVSKTAEICSVLIQNGFWKTFMNCHLGRSTCQWKGRQQRLGRVLAKACNIITRVTRDQVTKLKRCFHVCGLHCSPLSSIYLLLRCLPSLELVIVTLLPFNFELVVNGCWGSKYTLNEARFPQAEFFSEDVITEMAFFSQINKWVS